MRLTSKNYETDLSVPNDIIFEADGVGSEVHVQLNRFLGLLEANKLAIKSVPSKYICRMIQMFFEGLKPKLYT